MLRSIFLFNLKSLFLLGLEKTNIIYTAVTKDLVFVVSELFETAPFPSEKNLSIGSYMSATV